jgi:hypothetical protein
VPSRSRPRFRSEASASADVASCRTGSEALG